MMIADYAKSYLCCSQRGKDPEKIQTLAVVVAGNFREQNRIRHNFIHLKNKNQTEQVIQML